MVKKTKNTAPKELADKTYEERPVVILNKKELKRKATDKAKSKLNGGKIKSHT